MAIARKAQIAKRKRMVEIVRRFQQYVGTYTSQPEYADYPDETFINDMLYGLGIAIDPKDYYAASGFDKFKAVLRGRLGSSAGGNP